MRTQIPRSALLILVLILFGLDVRSSPAQTAPQPTSTPQLTVDDIVKLVQAGLSEDLVLAKIRQNGKAFDLGVDKLLRLKSASVSDQIIKEMMNPRAESVSTSAQNSAARPTVEAATASPPPAAVIEIGASGKKRGEWVEVLPEVVTWKTGGILKSIATIGVVKGDVNGRLQGPRA